MELPELLPFVAQVDDCDDPADLIDSIVLGGFVAGSHPFARSVRLQRVKPDAPLIPPGVVAARSAREPGRSARLAVGDGWLLRSTRWTDGTAYVVAVAETEDLAEFVIAQATADAVEPEEPSGEHTDVSFWHLTTRGPRRAARSVATPAWHEIRENYSASVASSIERITALRPRDLAGRLMLVQGPPGTGKTTALRALAREWRDWCRVEFVVDPDDLFRTSEYLMQVTLGDEDDDDADDEHWRLLVLEDCDELIRVDAKVGQGQALARLLNLTDGLVGQSLRVLVCISTNEDLGRLHPAVTRPGRCFSQLQVGALSRAEAVRWLGSERGIGPEGATLAELFALRGELTPVGPAPSDERIGLYL